MAHTNDVIFTEQGLAEFIQQIRQNPEMVCQVRAATNEEIARHNETHPTLAEGRIPGKGITIIWANGDKFSVAVGSDVKAPNFDAIVDNKNIQDGTISFIVDEETITIPVKGLISDWENNTYVPVNGDRKIPNKAAIKGYVEGYVEDYVNSALNGTGSDTGYGFIPGYYSADSNESGKRLWEVRYTQKSATKANLSANRVYGSVFNDYAEYRNTVTASPGRVVIENGDGSLSLSTKRLQLGANIISDTYGFAIGKTDTAQTPIAVCGRVLAYPYEELMLFTPGAAVCSGPNGTISLMTREEIREWPDAIIGYVSEIPTYEYWGTDNIKVDGRLWIKLA